MFHPYLCTFAVACNDGEKKTNEELLLGGKVFSQNLLYQTILLDQFIPYLCNRF